MKHQPLRVFAGIVLGAGALAASPALTAPAAADSIVIETDALSGFVNCDASVAAPLDLPATRIGVTTGIFDGKVQIMNPDGEEVMCIAGPGN